jgi:large subunit ribosomal protein L34
MSKTYNPKKKKRSAAHGFLSRSQTKNGQNILKRRRAKGRKQITTV